jgi:hypothetical protein
VPQLEGGWPAAERPAVEVEGRLGPLCDERFVAEKRVDCGEGAAADDGSDDDVVCGNGQNLALVDESRIDAEVAKAIADEAHSILQSVVSLFWRRGFLCQDKCDRRRSSDALVPLAAAEPQVDHLGLVTRVTWASRRTKRKRRAAEVRLSAGMSVEVDDEASDRMSARCRLLLVVALFLERHHLDVGAPFSSQPCASSRRSVGE